MRKLDPLFHPFLLCMVAFVVSGCYGATQTGQFAGPHSEALPRSEKGYELYSWQGADGAWRYTLITGTNRQKTAEELTAEEDVQTEEGWIKMSVAGTEALLNLLDRLPAGEQIFWHGAAAPPAGTGAGQFRLPGESVVTAVEARCRELDLQLITVADELGAVLTIPETLSTGEPVTLTFTLINHANYRLFVLKWYTPLEGIGGEIFQVKRNGQRLPYLGILAMRDDPSPESYVSLPPGGSVTSTVDLSQAYDFSEPGTYTVTFLSPRISHVARTEADMAQTVDELGPVAIASNTATVTVTAGE